MNAQLLSRSFRFLKSAYKLGVASLLCAAFLIVSTMQVAASPQVSFNGTGVGQIPDSSSAFPACQTPGAPLNISFNVTGLTANVQTVSLSLTLTHSHAGDLVARLIPPSGGNGFVIFGYIGSTNMTPDFISGDGSNFGGTYVFTDTAPSIPTLWGAAGAVGGDDVIPPGNYRTTAIGGNGPVMVTSLNAAFGGLTPAQANGIWTLRVTDGCNVDVGTVSAAVLDITTSTITPVAAKPFFDYFGTGKSSFAVYNNTGTNIIWRSLINGATVGPTNETVVWGLTDTDFLTPGYFNADNRADIGVWRPSATAGESRFFIRITNPISLFTFPFGSGTSQNSGDFAGYDADFDGDGRDDPTTIRIVNGQWLWSYQSSQTNSLRSIPFGRAIGDVNTDDIPFAGGDFSGDGRADIVVLRQNAAGPETYIWGDSQTGQVLGSFSWGEFNTDFYVLGDFIGDSRFDFAVWRGAVANADANWYIRENGGNGFVARPFGFSGNPMNRDLAVAGDFGGDGKYDIAVYRRSNNTFYWYNSLTDTALQSQQFGQAGDRPVGELRTY